MSATQTKAEASNGKSATKTPLAPVRISPLRSVQQGVRPPAVRFRGSLTPGGSRLPSVSIRSSLSSGTSRADADTTIAAYAEICGQTLTRAYTRVGDAVATPATSALAIRSIAR